MISRKWAGQQEVGRHRCQSGLSATLQIKQPEVGIQRQDTWVPVIVVPHANLLLPHCFRISKIGILIPYLRVEKMTWYHSMRVLALWRERSCLPYIPGPVHSRHLIFDTFEYVTCYLFTYYSDYSQPLTEKLQCPRESFLFTISFSVFILPSKTSHSTIKI